MNDKISSNNETNSKDLQELSEKLEKKIDEDIETQKN